ncbi:hypothetical protein RALTA_B1152 [Cupriavidus taiwanensis LMG 19424]|uniref:Uncharacterized protein n=1 Tax=Cupriavidus taiwanensis (strain DSM 17343 / BCRC 17206 / CCUG 44338 / CIP 107171 / LMG 19424 / R1) TaxID=977880 RepID=B3RA30_CUPTR|nr:hypothetical protein RALTA_B1152 [Cupriavidus taiwanensis LMG 19424]
MNAALRARSAGAADNGRPAIRKARAMPFAPSSVRCPRLLSAAARPALFRRLVLAAALPLLLLSVASVFGLQAGWPASWYAWRHVDASLPLVALGALAAGPLLAICTEDRARTVASRRARSVARGPSRGSHACQNGGT